MVGHIADSISKQNSLEENPMKKYIISSLAKRYLPIKPDSFFDLFLVDIKRRVSLTLEKVMLACSEEVIGLRSCVLIEGESGRGKTFLMRQMASQWAEKKVLQEFSAVFLYEVYVENLEYDGKGTRKDSNYYAFGFPHADYEDNRESADLIDRLLEEDAKLLHGSTDRKDILILLDSFWYLPTQSIIQTCRRYFPNAAIVFTAQPCFVKKIKKDEIQSITHYFKVLGYDPNVINVVLQFLLPHQVESFHSWLETNPFAQALIHCPLYCKMLTELCLHNALPDYLKNLTELFKLHIIFMINKSRKDSDPIEYFSDLTGDDDLLFRSIVEISLIFPKIYKAGSCKLQLIKSFGLLKKISFNDHSIISFVNSSVMAYFMALSYTVSVNKPIKKIPLAWSEFNLYLTGMKNLNTLYVVDKFRKSQLEDISLFEICLIIFELQSSILDLEMPQRSESTKKPVAFLYNKIFESCYNSISLEPDPIALYVLGWMCTALRRAPFRRLSGRFHMSIVLLFDIPYISEISKYLFYFSKGTKHIANFPCSNDDLLQRLIHIEILNVVDDIDKCLQYLIDANLCKCLTKLQFSGTVNLKASLLDEIVDKHHLSGLTNLDITGKLTSTEYNDAFLIIVPRLGSLHNFALHNRADTASNACKVDLKCMQDITNPCMMKINGFSPDFFIKSLQKDDCHLNDITIMNCKLSPVNIESLLEWLMQPYYSSSLTLEGQGILSAETSIQIALTLDNLKTLPLKKCSISLNDTTMSSAVLALIIDVVSRLNIIELYIPMKYWQEFWNRNNLHYNYYKD